MFVGKQAHGMGRFPKEGTKVFVWHLVPKMGLNLQGGTTYLNKGEEMFV